jgi:arylsulfatase A-like enzyme
MKRLKQYFGLLLLAFLTFACQTNTKEQQPNVLFIAVDDLNNWVGCMDGHPDTQTPNIDKLASEGVLFTNAHCTAPLCGPSRISIATGLHPVTTGYYMNSQGSFRTGLPNVHTLPQYFKENGYYVMGAGKLYPDSKSGYDRSFHEFQKVDTSAVFNINQYIYNNGPVGRFKKWVLDGGPLDIEDDMMVDGYNSKWAVDKLKNGNFDKPFFLAVGIFRPHIDWFVPRKYFDKFDPEKIALANVKENDLDDVPEYGKELAICTGDAATLKRCNQERQATAAYLACVNFADAMIGRVLDALHNSKYADNTIVVLWSDHGWHHGEKEHWRKFTLWQKGTRVPFIVKVPQAMNNGKVCNEPVSLVDIYPTLLDLCGLPANQTNDGKSIAPLLLEKNADWDRPVLITYGRGNNSIKDERYNYIQYYDGTEELYDRQTDPNEWTNLAQNPKYAEHIARLKKHIPAESANYQLKANGSKIVPWHKTFSYINGLDVEFIDW